MITREEFREGLEELVEDFNDPDGSLPRAIADGKVAAEEVMPYDPILAAKITTIVSSIEDFISYAKTRAEN